MDDIPQSDVGNVVEFSVIAFEPSENPPWRSEVQEYPSIQQMITDIVEFQRKAKEVNTVQRDTIQKYFLACFIFNNHDKEHGVGTLEETVECIRKVESNEEQLEKAPSVAEQETINVYKAYRYLQQQVEEETEECGKDLHGLLESYIIKEMHKIVLEGTANNKSQTLPGEYSTLPRLTTFNDVRHDYRHYPKPEDMEREVNKIIDRYNSLIEDLKGDSDAASRILKLFKTSSWLLFELLDLHPFGNANGRLCRLLCNYALSVFTPFPTPIYNIWSESSKDDYLQTLVDARESSSRHPEALTTMLIECNWLAWKEFYRRLEQAN